MPTLTVYSEPSDGYIESSDTTYATARSGGSFQLDNTDTSLYFGQVAGFFLYEAFLNHDTASLPDDAIIISAELSGYGFDDGSVTDFTIEARLRDWGDTLETSDWVPGASLSGLTRLATLPTSGFSTTGYNAFTEDGSNLRNNINRTGKTRIILCSDRTTSGTAPSGNEYAAIYSGDEAGTTKDPKLVVTYTIPAGPVRPHPRKRDTIPPVYCRLDGHPIGLRDWKAQTIANGGDLSLRGIAHVKDRQKFPSSFEQGAPIRLVLGDDRTIWEGELAADPLDSAGELALVADGPMLQAMEIDDTLFYQSRDVSLGKSEADAPFNGTPAAGINAQVGDGSFHFSVPQGTALALDEAAAICVPMTPARARRLRGSLYVAGPAGAHLDKFAFNVYRATFPSGARTSITSVTPLANGTLIDAQPATAEDMFVVELRCNAPHTTTLPIDVWLRDFRVNDLTLADELTASALVADIGRRLGWDVAGIPAGPGIDTANPSIGTWNLQGTEDYDPHATFYQNLRSGGIKILPGSVSPAITTSPLNILPFVWGGGFGGSWKDALDFAGSFLDWPWAADPNHFGRGPVVRFGEWGPTYTVRTSKNAVTHFDPRVRYGEIIVRYPTPAGNIVELRQDVQQPPSRHRRRRRRPYKIALDMQKDDKLARTILGILVQRVGQIAVTGSLTITGVEGGGTLYDPRAGCLAVVSDYGPTGMLPLRIAHTEMSPRGTTLGIGDFASVEARLAVEARMRQRDPYGVLQRMVFHPGPRKAPPRDLGNAG